jgi:hypothetical protein
VIKEKVNVRFVKQALGISYFNSVEIITVSSDRDFTEVYNQTECFQTLFLSRNKINLNLYMTEVVGKFVDDCKDAVADAFVNEALPFVF